jgi:23S rRNA pseudouridine1911/1915/1917 synthase
MEIAILYEDDDLIVIDKPAGVTVNRAETTKNEITVQDWAADNLNLKDSEIKINKDLEYDPVQEFINRGGVVHRLDKETSGILLLAKNPEAFVALQKQFKEREVKKVY